jgi:hypothetical protein
MEEPDHNCGPEVDEPGSWHYGQREVSMDDVDETAFEGQGWLGDAVMRLLTALGEPLTDKNQSLALGSILLWDTLEFDDGWVLDSPSAEGLGFADAAFIVAALSSPPLTWSRWKSALEGPRPAEFYETRQAMRDRLARAPSVRRVLAAPGTQPP